MYYLSIKFVMIIAAMLFASTLASQETQIDNQPEKLKISGEFLSDQKMLLKNDNSWAWNENRITFKAEKKVSGQTSFYSEFWARNIGIPKTLTSSDLINKGITDPYQFEIREAYLEIVNFPIKNLDLKIGRQRIEWGTADKFNPTNNLNPYDLEDILDFGRRRPTEAINLNYYFNSDFSLQAVFVPIFKSSNLPIGIFSEVLTPEFAVPSEFTVKNINTNIETPKLTLKENSSLGFRFKGFAKGIDFSLSYSNVYDAFPFNTENVITPFDAFGGINVNSTLTYSRTNIFGIDLSSNLRGIGVWAEAALFMPTESIYMKTDITALFPPGSAPIILDSLILDSQKPFFKTAIGFDYHFANKTYLNMQYLHGFFHERGRENMNNYLIMTYDINLLRERLTVSPLAGAVSFKEIDNFEEYSFAYMPKIEYKASPDTKVSVSALFSDGKGENIFAKLKEYNMLMLRVKHYF